MKYYKKVLGGFNPERPIIEIVEPIESHELKALAYGSKYAIDRLSVQEINHIKIVGVDYRTYEFPKLYMAVVYQEDGEIKKRIKECSCISHISPYPAHQMAHSARNLAERLIDDLTGQGGLGWRHIENALANPQLKVV